jgi:hypothetical protein
MTRLMALVLRCGRYRHETVAHARNRTRVSVSMSRRQFVTILSIALASVLGMGSILMDLLSKRGTP